MNRIPLPDKWIWYEQVATTWNPFSIYGYCFRAKHLITFYPKKWMWPKFVYNFFKNKVYRHEVSHAWGIDGCSKPWCIMFEAKEWKKEWSEAWWEKPLGAFFQTITLFRYCKEHRKFMEAKLCEK